MYAVRACLHAEDEMIIIIEARSQGTSRNVPRNVECPIPTFCHSDDALKLPTRTTHHAPPCPCAQAKKEKHEHLTGLAKIKHDESYLTTGKEFQKLHGHKAKIMDKKIAKEAGLKDMGWMGSKSYIDQKLEVLFISANFSAQSHAAAPLAVISTGSQSLVHLEGGPAPRPPPPRSFRPRPCCEG